MVVFMEGNLIIFNIEYHIRDTESKVVSGL